MAHDVLISHSHQDKRTADAFCAGLESHGVKCWIAPRDVQLGTEYADSIVQAIEAAQVVVLLFSAHAERSHQVRREVERAVSKGITIVPVRIDAAEMGRAFELYLSQMHWLDAADEPVDQHIDQLAADLTVLLQDLDPDRTRVGHIQRTRTRPVARTPPTVRKERLPESSSDEPITDSGDRSGGRPRWLLPIGLGTGLAVSLLLFLTIPGLWRQGGEALPEETACANLFQTALRDYVAASDFDSRQLGVAFGAASDCGDERATMWLARGHYLGRLGYALDTGRAARLAAGVFEPVEQRAVDGDPQAQFLLASAYQQGLIVDENLVEALRWFRRSAEGGDALAQYGLGMILIQGDDVEQDEAGGERWLMKAADQNMSRAAYALGSRSLDANEADESLRWFQEAADLGHPFAMAQLGYMLETGLGGTTPDVCQACSWYEQAASAGVAAGEVNLGLCFDRDVTCVDNSTGARLFSRDPCVAKEWFERAAEEGYPHGQYNLARSIITGECERPTDADLRDADSYLRSAASAGFAQAVQYLEQVESSSPAH